MRMLQKKIMRPNMMLPHNAFVVLELIKNRGPMSRAAIARELKFSKSAASNVITFLANHNLVSFTGVGESALGKKPLIVDFNPKAHYFLAANLNRSRKAVGLVDLSGQAEEVLQLESSLSAPQHLIESVVGTTSKLLSRAKIARQRIEGMGVVVPGIVDVAEGTVVYSSLLGWDKPVPLSRELSKRLRMPVTVENDVNALALGEAWVGRGKGYRVVGLLFIGEGIGGALIADGQVLHGADYAAAELGKAIIGGGTEAIEKSLILPRIAERVEMSSGLTRGDLSYDDFFLSLAERARNGDSESLAAIDKMAEDCAPLTASIVAFYNPDIIILDSPLLKVGSRFLDKLTDGTLALLPRNPRRTVRIVASLGSAKAALVGGCAVAMLRSRFGFIVAGSYAASAERE